MQRNIIDFSSFYDPDKQSLDLSSQDVTDLDIADYIIPFLHNHPVTTLNLSHNRITAAGLAVLTHYLKMHQYPLKALDMSHNPLKEISRLHEQTELQGKVLSPPSLITLNLSHTNIESSSLEALKVFPLLQELDISDNHLKDISTLKEYVGTSLIKLNVSNTNIEPSSLKALKAFHFLQELDISHNALKHIRPLKKMRSLTKLKMSHNDFASFEWDDLGNFSFLTELDISHNKINKNSHVFNALYRLRYLTKLNISHNPIQDDGVKSLLIYSGGYVLGRTEYVKNAILRYSAKKPFTDMNVSDCGLGDEAIFALASLPDLVNFDFSQNNMTLDGAKAILELPNIDPLKKVNYIKQHAELFSSLTDEEKKELQNACNKASSLRNISIFELSKSIPGFTGCSLLVKEYDLTSNHEGVRLSQEQDKEKARKYATPLLYREKTSSSTKYFLYGDPVGNDENWQETEIAEIESGSSERLFNIDILFHTAYLHLSPIRGFVEIKSYSPALTLPFLKESEKVENEKEESEKVENEKVEKKEKKLTIVEALSKGHHYLKPLDEKIRYLAVHGYKSREMINVELEEKITQLYDPYTRSLNLSNLNLTDEDFIHFVLPVLQEHPDIASLDLSGNKRLGEESIQYLSDYLHDKNLTTLCLNGINFPVARWKQMGDCLKDIGRIQSLTTLEISNNNLPLGSMATLLSYLPRLQSIDISDNPLDKKDLTAINRCTSLRKIKMSNCHIEKQFGTFLTEKVICFNEIMPNLVELDMSHNGIIFLPPHLDKYPSLESLIVNDNPSINISSSDVLKNKKITTIKISNCHLGSRDIGKLSVGELVNAPHLIDLDLTGNGITFAQAWKYMQIHPENKQKYLQQICEEKQFSDNQKKLLKIDYAVEMNNVEELKSLMDPSHDGWILGQPSSDLPNDETLLGALLSRAIIRGHEEIALYLLEQLSKLNIDKNSFFHQYTSTLVKEIHPDEIMTFFRFFFKHNEETAVGWLIQIGADINQPVNPAAPISLSFIHQAVMDGNLKMISAMNWGKSNLVELLKLKDSDGLNPLLKAATEQKHANVALYLLKNVLKDEEIRIRKDLLSAEKDNDVESFKKLIENFKANVKQCDFVANSLDTEDSKAECDAIFKYRLKEVLNNKENDQSYSLRRAVENGRVKIVDYLLSQGVTDNSCTCLNTALRMAKSLDIKFPIVVSLIENEKALEKDLLDASAGSIHYFRWAFNHGRTKAVSLLIQTYNIDVMEKVDPTKSKSNSPSFIHQAVIEGNLEMVKAIISAAPHFLEYKDKRGYTPLMAARAENKKNPDLILYLLEKSLEQNIKKHRFNFNLAVDDGNLQKVKTIVETFTHNDKFFPEIQKQCDELIRKNLSHFLDLGIEEHRLTPLMLAVEHNHTEIMNYLLDQGANPNARIEEGYHKGESAFYIAYKKYTFFGDDTKKYALIALIKKGFDVTQLMQPISPNSVSFIHDAARRGDLGMIKLMVEGTEQAGKDILSLLSCKDTRGCTPLMYAAGSMKSNQVTNDLLDYLLTEGVNVNDSNNEGTTALCYALWAKCFVNAVALIKKGADISTITLEERMLLYYFALENNENEVVLQLEKDKEVFDQLLNMLTSSADETFRPVISELNDEEFYQEFVHEDERIEIKMEGDDKVDMEEFFADIPYSFENHDENDNKLIPGISDAIVMNKNDNKLIPDIPDKNDNKLIPDIPDKIVTNENDDELIPDIPDKMVTNKNEIIEMAKSIFADEENQASFIARVELQDKTQLPSAYDKAYADTAKLLIYQVANRFGNENQKTFKIFAKKLSSRFFESKGVQRTFEETVLQRACDQVLMFNQLEQMLDKEKKAFPAAFRSQFVDLAMWNILKIAAWDKNEGSWKTEIANVKKLILEKVSLLRFLRHEYIRIQDGLGKFMNDNIKTHNKLNVIVRNINRLESGREEEGFIKNIEELEALKTRLLKSKDFTQSRNRFFTIESDTKKHFENRYAPKPKK